VLTWEPPFRLLLSWDINADWQYIARQSVWDTGGRRLTLIVAGEQYDAALKTKLEIRFIAQGMGAPSDPIDGVHPFRAMASASRRAVESVDRSERFRWVILGSAWPPPFSTGGARNPIPYKSSNAGPTQSGQGKAALHRGWRPSLGDTSLIISICGGPATSIPDAHLELSQRAFFFGDEPRGTDAIVFATRAGTILAPIDLPVRDYLRSQPACGYVERLGCRFFPELTEGAAAER
jgi:hypothetical protein